MFHDHEPDDKMPRAAAERVPAGARIVNVECMSRAFVKYHLDDGRALQLHPKGSAR